MSTLTIVRGWPGSGKTTFARTLNGTLYETDQYWTRPDGYYDFNPRRIKEAHAWCKSRVNLAMINGWKVVVANTFTQLWEMQDYIKMAEEYGYKVCVYRCQGNYQNVHGVPEDKVEVMKQRMQDYEGEIYV